MNNFTKFGSLKCSNLTELENLKVCCRFMYSDNKVPKFQANTNPMLPKDTFKGKVAFVTGGGTGIGRSIAMMLSKLGADVAIISRRLETVKKTSRDITNETGGNVLSMQCDTTDELNVRNAISKCITELGLPSLIVNSSSKNLITPTERLNIRDFQEIVNTTLNGTANVTFDLAKRLISSGQGATFLNISSNYSLIGSGYVVASAAAKSGVNTLTKSLASEWSRHGMRFNSIAIGPVSTQISENLRKEAMRMLDGDGSLKGDIRTTRGRTAKVEEVANLAAYLLSDYANFINGQIISFDGGEANYKAGEFNELEHISKEHWDMITDSHRVKSSH